MATTINNNQIDNTNTNTTTNTNTNTSTNHPSQGRSVRGVADCGSTLKEVAKIVGGVFLGIVLLGVAGVCVAAVLKGMAVGFAYTLLVGAAIGVICVAKTTYEVGKKILSCKE